MILSNIGEHEELIIKSSSDLEAAFRAVLEDVLSGKAEDKEKEKVMITRCEASKRLNVDRSTLWRWDKMGYLKAHRRGRAVLYLEKDVEELVRGIVR